MDIKTAIERHNKFIYIEMYGYKLNCKGYNYYELYYKDELLLTGHIEDLYKMVNREQKLKRLGL